MTERIPQSVAKTVVFKAYLASDHVTEATGKTIAITISKNGATSFSNPAAGATNATEMASGWYKVALGTGDTDTVGPLAIRGAVATIDDVGILCEVVKATNAGFSALPDTACTTNASLPTVGTGTSQISLSSGQVIIQTGTGTGQLDFTSGVVKANATQWLGGTIPAVNITGVPLVDAKYLLGTIFSTPTVAGIPNVNAKTWNDLATVALPLVPTVAGRALDVSAGGEAGLDWANVGSPTTSLALTGTTIATTQKVDIETIKTNPVVNGGTITFPTTATLASTTNITAGTIATVTNLTNAPTAGDFTATMKTSLNAATPALSAAGVQAIWDALISALTTVGSIGKLLADNINATITSRMATYTQPTGFLAATFPSGTVANTTNITAGTVTTATNLTNAPTAGDFTAAMKTSLNAATPAASLSSGERNSMADAILDRDMSVGTDSGTTIVRTVRQALRALRNKWTVSGGTYTVKKEDDSADSWSSAVAGTAGADPITSSDPAGP